MLLNKHIHDVPSLELYEPLAASYLPNVKLVDIVMLGKKMFDFTSHFRFPGNRGTVLPIFRIKCGTERPLKEI